MYVCTPYVNFNTNGHTYKRHEHIIAKQQQV